MVDMLTLNYSFWGLIIHFYTGHVTEVSFLVDFV